MIQWIYGASGAGKTTLARKLQQAETGTVLLDGDDMRRVWTDLDHSDEGRMEQNKRIANLARVLERQGFSVIVATICPTPEIRKAVADICACSFIHLEDTKDEKSWVK